MKNWRTTLAGIVAASGPIINSSFSEKFMHEIGSALGAIGVAALGILAADSHCMDPNCPKGKDDKQTRLALMFAFLVIGWLAFMLMGCAGKPVLSPQAVQGLVSEGTIVGVQFYPQARPGIAVARDVMCADAAQTNVNPARIVADLAGANITNRESMLIVNAALAIYQSVFSVIGSNNYAKALPYLQSLCAGLTEGLPPGRLARKLYLKP